MAGRKPAGPDKERTRPPQRAHAAVANVDSCVLRNGTDPIWSWGPRVALGGEALSSGHMFEGARLACIPPQQFPLSLLQLVLRHTGRWQVAPSQIVKRHSAGAVASGIKTSCVGRIPKLDVEYATVTLLDVA